MAIFIDKQIQNGETRFEAVFCQMRSAHDRIFSAGEQNDRIAGQDFYDTDTGCDLLDENSGGFNGLNPHCP